MLSSTIFFRRSGQFVGRQESIQEDISAHGLSDKSSLKGQILIGGKPAISSVTATKNELQQTY
jgi:hypothetical protein